MNVRFDILRQSKKKKVQSENGIQCSAFFFGPMVNVVQAIFVNASL